MHLIIKSITGTPREGWTEIYKIMAQNKDDTLLDDASLSQKWDQEEWEWQECC